jgi:hypothetical protein
VVVGNAPAKTVKWKTILNNTAGCILVLEARAMQQRLLNKVSAESGYDLGNAVAQIAPYIYPEDKN